jgi:hypothetical protein
MAETVIGAVSEQEPQTVEVAVIRRQLQSGVAFLLETKSESGIERRRTSSERSTAAPAASRRRRQERWPFKDASMVAVRPS